MKLFSKLYLADAFRKNSRKYMRFQIYGVVYHFKVLLFGIKSACSALALHKLVDKCEDFVVQHIDDILIFSEHLKGS